MPIFSHSDECFVISEVELDDNKICKQQPLGCTDSLTFVVDSNALDHTDDIRMDDLGVWEIHRSYFNVFFSSQKKVSLIEKLSDNFYIA